MKGFINKYRRIFMRILTKSFGNNQKTFELEGDIKRILISRPNSRLGNLLLITPLVQEVSILFPNCKIDLFVRSKTSMSIFKNYECVNAYIILPNRPFSHLISYIHEWIKVICTKYDMAINAEIGSSSGRLSVKLSRSRYKIYDIADKELQYSFGDYQHMAKHIIYNVRKVCRKRIQEEIPTLDIKLSNDEKQQGWKLLQQLTDNQKPTICIYTYATGAKCFNKTWWHDFYERLKEICASDYFNIVEILPKENISQINFAAPSFYSLNIREIASFIAAADYFIGADCGIMHLAVASGTPTIGLFSVTDALRYAPYGNGNSFINTENKSVEEICNLLNNDLKNRAHRLMFLLFH